MLLCICDKCGAPATNKFVYSYHLEIDSVGYVDKDFNRVSGRTVERIYVINVTIPLWV